MPTLKEIYAGHCAANTAISPHLPRLCALADKMLVCAEFGVKRGASSSALLSGCLNVISYDIKETPEALALKRAVPEWDYRIGDSRTAGLGKCDLLFIDSQHDYEQCRAELDEHADTVSTYLVFHDTVTFGSIGAQGETGEHKWQYKKGLSCPASCLGIRPAIDELMIRDPSWHILAHYTDSHGLLILTRR